MRSGALRPARRRLCKRPCGGITAFHLFEHTPCALAREACLILHRLVERRVSASTPASQVLIDRCHHTASRAPLVLDTSSNSPAVVAPPSGASKSKSRYYVSIMSSTHPSCTHIAVYLHKNVHLDSSSAGERVGAMCTGKFQPIFRHGERPPRKRPALPLQTCSRF